LTTETQTQTAENVSLAGLILAGGMSRRMGTDKAALLLGGQTFIERIFERLAGGMQPILVVGRAEQVVALEKLLQKSSVISPPEIISDRYPDRGPLEALATGLETLAARGVHLAAVTTCDAPNVAPRLFFWLAGQLNPQQQIIMPTDGKHRYGLTAVYRTGCAVKIRELLEQGLRRVIDLPLHLPTASVKLEECRSVDPQLQSFRNANTPQEYEVLRADLEERQGRG
jgi:molybdopterin-guanine dinucleotide biosynthesis protein A